MCGEHVECKICKKLLKLVDFLFNFAISKFDVIAIFQNRNCQVSSKAVLVSF